MGCSTCNKRMSARNLVTHFNGHSGSQSTVPTESAPGSDAPPLNTKVTQSPANPQGTGASCSRTDFTTHRLWEGSALTRSPGFTAPELSLPQTLQFRRMSLTTNRVGRETGRWGGIKLSIASTSVRSIRQDTEDTADGEGTSVRLIPNKPETGIT